MVWYGMNGIKIVNIINSARGRSCYTQGDRLNSCLVSFQMGVRRGRKGKREGGREGKREREWEGVREGAKIREGREAV